jgi:glyoxylase-like metal-dependent hydrolase (beta-lactamase superfamily II)
VTSGTREVEIQLQGDAPTRFDPDIRFIPVPGHTAGSVCMLYRERFLFAGDHAWWDERNRRVAASRSVCWYDWPKQTASMARLADHAFEWLLPGHGLRCRLPQAQMRAQILACAQRMQRR